VIKPTKEHASKLFQEIEALLSEETFVEGPWIQIEEGLKECCKFLSSLDILEIYEVSSCKEEICQGVSNLVNCISRQFHQLL